MFTEILHTEVASATSQITISNIPQTPNSDLLLVVTPYGDGAFDFKINGLGFNQYKQFAGYGIGITLYVSVNPRGADEWGLAGFANSRLNGTGSTTLYIPKYSESGVRKYGIWDGWSSETASDGRFIFSAVESFTTNPITTVALQATGDFEVKTKVTIYNIQRG